MKTVSVELSQLFATVEESFQKTTLATDCWYLLVVSCLATGPNPEMAADLYLYITSKPEYSTSDARQRLVRRLREALVKSVALVGVCKPLQATYAISTVEQDADKDYTVSRAGWQCDQVNHDRGREFFRKLYGKNANDTDGLFAAHGDFDFVCENIIYGFFFGDRATLDDVQTEIVILAAIMSQNLKLESNWHIRGIRRLGLSRDQVSTLCDAIKLVADHFGVKLNNVPTVDEVESSV